MDPLLKPQKCGFQPIKIDRYPDFKGTKGMINLSESMIAEKKAIPE